MLELERIATKKIVGNVNISLLTIEYSISKRCGPLYFLFHKQFKTKHFCLVFIFAFHAFMFRAKLSKYMLIIYTCFGV